MRVSQFSIFLTVIGLSHGYTFSSVPNYVQGYAPAPVPQTYYRSRALQYEQQNDINRPIIYPQLGMSPQYQNIVYKYVADYAGNGSPPQVKVAEFNQRATKKSEKIDESGGPNPLSEGEKTVPETDKPGLDDFLLPSDYILLRQAPGGQFFENINAIKTKPNFKSNSKTNPPLGGVMSNYILLRSRPDYQNYTPFSGFSDVDDNQVSKRQVGDDSDDTVVINAENPHNVKMNEENDDPMDQSMANDGDDEEDQPAIAQSKPAAIALAGPGGVAQASPVGTALVGAGGLAVAAPSGTAVAGPAGQGAIAPTADDKTKIIQKKIKEVWN